MSENDPRMPQDNNSNDPKNESPVNYKGLIFIGIACFLIFLAILTPSQPVGQPAGELI